MAPVKYMTARRKNTKACTRATKIPNAMMGRGAKKRPGQGKQDAQYQLMTHHVTEKTEERDKILAACPMSSMGRMMGIIHHTGPMKCL